ncbi:hypothetical protein AB1Y20_020200 [Prymnesium parvum]|uniref:Uncharacterized protein n=1 Tax=Prymnesium parvum TaxID=97485 RepID=A0AB34JXG1_PRYPA
MADDDDHSTCAPARAFTERDTSARDGTDDFTRPLLDSFSVDMLLRRLGANGADAAMLEQFSTLLKSCNVSTVGALRRFASLTELTAEMFDTTTSLGRLKAQGLLASIHDVQVPLASCTAPAGRRSSSISSSSGLTASKSTKMVLHGNLTVSPHSIQSLPSHLVIEASRLRDLCRSEDIALSEHLCRPLVQSTALWLINMGVTHEAYHPGVFDKVGSLLHKELPTTMLQLKGSASSKKPGSAGQKLFSRRIQDYMKNTIRKADWQLQVPVNAELSTPLRALKDAGKVYSFRDKW